MFDSLQQSTFPDLDVPQVAKTLAESPFFPQPLPHYDLLVHLRHHGFPSPLLDWTRSFYVASFFAFEAVKGESVAIFIYQEFTGTAKHHTPDEPHLVSFGPWVRTHPRHVLQQAQYTIAVQHESETWRIAKHEEVFSVGLISQDRLTKLVVPASQAAIALSELDEMNINAYSLYQTQDALLQTVGQRVFR